MIQISLGKMLRTARVSGRVSLRELAFDLCITDVELGEYERGVREPTSWTAVFEELGKVIYTKAFTLGFDANRRFSPEVEAAIKAAEDLPEPSKEP